MDVVKKEDCMDLPPKIFEKMIVKPSKEQIKAIKDLQASWSAEQENREITVDSVMTRMTRVQQIVGGTFPYEGEDGYETIEIDGKNPKLGALEEILESIGDDTKVIIWCRFRPEIRYVVRFLQNTYGHGSVVEYHGDVESDQRTEHRIKFQEDDSVRFFVANQQTGGYGLTLTAASVVVYYSNSFSYEDRRQSEDRCHRKGQTRPVTYIDIEMEVLDDQKILLAIARKQDLATLVDEELS